MKQYEAIVEMLRGYLPEYMAQRGQVVGESGRRKIHCINPVHQDRTPSMSYYPRSKKLHCFGCGISYDLFDVIAMDYPECDSFTRQVKKACELFGLEYPEEYHEKKEPCYISTHSRKVVEENVPYASVQAEGASNFHFPALSYQWEGEKSEQDTKETIPNYNELVEDAIAQNGMGGTYFKRRGLSQALCERYRLFEKDGRAYMPIYVQGNCICYCARAIQDTLQPRYKNSSGPMELFNGDYLDKTDLGGALFIMESIFDALSVEECGYHAIALCGTGNVRRFLERCAGNLTAANSFTMVAAGDADEAGRRMNEILKKGLETLGISCTTLTLPDGCKDANEALIQEKETFITVLETTIHKDKIHYLRQNAASALEELFNLHTSRACRQAIPTGFAGLDRILDGGLYSGLYIIGAISSIGKTSFVLQLADFIAAQERDVLYFSLEMSKLELIAKSISRLTWQLDTAVNRKNAFTVRQVLCIETHGKRGQLLQQAAEQYQKVGANLFFKEGLADIGAKKIRKDVHDHIQLRGRKPIVIVDYLQILQADHVRTTDKQNIDRAVVELKRISRDFDIPVIAVSSFNRENYRNAVSMEAFKESGAVEYSSDVLLGLQLAGAGEAGFDVNLAKTRSPRSVELVLLKNRNGIPYAKLNLIYEAKYSIFMEKNDKTGI